MLEDVRAHISQAGPQLQVDLSLVICTRDRASQLGPALESCAKLLCKRPWELVIVDNGSRDETPEIVTDFVGRFRGVVRTLQEKRAGLARARNAGWKAASGRIVVFTDDDCYPQSDYLEQLYTCFQEESLGFMGGRVLLFDPEDAPITIQFLNRRVDLPPYSYVPPGLIHGANFAFRHDVLDAIGGFDVRLGAGTRIFAAEDADALARASAHGFRGVYDPRPVVFHHHRRRDAEVVRSMRKAYSIGLGAYYLKCTLNPRVGYKYLLRWPRAMYRAGARGAAWYVTGAWRFARSGRQQ